METDAASTAGNPRRDAVSAISAPEQAIDDLLREGHLAGSHELPDLFARYGEALGVIEVVVYLADLQQALLIPFMPITGPLPGEDPQALRIGSTIAGRVYQHIEPMVQHVGQDGDGQDGDAQTEAVVWLPLLDGTERLGVMGVRVPDAAEVEPVQSPLMVRLRRLASLAAELLTTKTVYGDTIVRLRRTTDMGLAAEMQWTLLPPLTFSSGAVTIAGGLEPAYEVAGDSVDYAVDAGTAKFAVFDGMGHGLRSAQLATLAVAAYRNARRGNRTLTTTARNIDEAVLSGFAGDIFITGILAELDTDSGVLSWVNAGHPDPLLLRAGRLVKPLHAEPMLPFGLSTDLGYAADIHLGSESLQPGDLVLLYTDGIIEARSPNGDFFGQDRLVDLLSRNLAAGLPAPESMRRIIRALLEHQQGQLSDDATMLFVQWQPSRPEELLP